MTNKFLDFPPILNSFDKETLINLPQLNLGNKVGFTGYIDFIKIEDMENSIMSGLDLYKRPFLAIKYHVKTDKEEFDSVGTFFQRYSDNRNSWAFGTYYPIHNQIYEESRVRLDDYDLLTSRLISFLTKPEIIIKNYYTEYKISKII